MRLSEDQIIQIIALCRKKVDWSGWESFDDFEQGGRQTAEEIFKILGIEYQYWCEEGEGTWKIKELPDLLMVCQEG